MRLATRSPAPSGPAPGAAGLVSVSPDEFAVRMAALAPFEARPHLAVAVSGGRDSLALALLAQDWVVARRGRLTALIVDHRLRPDSTHEAQHVATLLRTRGIDTDILAWTDDKPGTGVSEAARTARYELLQQRCRAFGILHLLLGHQADDQAETVLLRLADGSGPEGLAGMAGIAERSGLRLLRPLLGIARARLAATVLAAGLRWIDDPSNQRTDYARIRARQSLDDETRAALNDVAASSAQVRRSVDARLAAMMVDLVSADPRGFAWLDRTGFAALPDAIARRVLGRLAATYGGRHYPARNAGLRGAIDLLCGGRSAVAGGCRFILRGKRILACREAGAIDALNPMRLEPMHWDRRYVLTVPRGCSAAAIVGPLGVEGRKKAVENCTVALMDLPAPVAEALPGLWQEGELRAVFLPKTPRNPAGGGDGRDAPAPATVISCLDAVFRPAQGLARPAWPLVLPSDEPIYLD